jgi:hypothetical protein
VIVGATEEGLTVRVTAGLLTLPWLALTCEVPVPTPVAKPELAPIVATDKFEEVQATLAVMFCVLLSLKVPVAVNCKEEPCESKGLVGVTAIEMRVGGV